MRQIFREIDFMSYNFTDFCKKSQKNNSIISMYRYALRYESIMWKLLQFSLTYFGQKFRESNVFTKEITEELI